MELTSIASSSEGNSIFVGSKETKLLVDCGISAKRIEKSLDELDTRASELSGILITHEHSDHIKGLGVMLRRYGTSGLRHGKDHRRGFGQQVHRKGRQGLVSSD